MSEYWSVNDYYASVKAGKDAEEAFFNAKKEKIFKAFKVEEADQNFTMILNGHKAGNSHVAYERWRTLTDKAWASFIAWKKEPQTVKKAGEIYNKAVKAYPQ